jgi:hypothetical protein
MRDSRRLALLAGLQLFMHITIQQANGSKEHQRYKHSTIESWFIKPQYGQGANSSFTNSVKSPVAKVDMPQEFRENQLILMILYGWKVSKLRK